MSLSSSVPGQDLRHRYPGTRVHTCFYRSCYTGKEHLTPCFLFFIFVSILSAAVSACRYKNGGCVQYCKDLQGGAGVQCGCADGYELESDGHRCTKTGDITALQSHCA